MRFLLFGSTAFLVLYFLLATCPIPIEDQLWICKAAVGLHDYDFSMFVPGAYMDVFAKQQPGIALFLWGFFSVFGEYNYRAFQMMNAGCILLDLFLIEKIYNAACSCWNTGKEVRELTEDTAVYIGMICFLPFFLYVTYVYGTLLGLTLSLGAALAMLRYIESRKKGYLCMVPILCALAVWIKVNYLIFVIAIVVFLLVDLWKSRRPINLVGILAIVLAISGLGCLSDAVIEKRTGMKLSEGAPMLCWITMAFCEDEKGNPVGYNNYVTDVYYGNDRDVQQTASAAYEDLKTRFAELTKDSGRLLEFMGKKIAMQWNEPSFEGIHINTRHIARQTKIPDFFESMLQNYEMNWFAKYVNLFHSAVLLGALTWVLLCGKETCMERVFCAVVFIGGFLFSLFWESGSRYMLVYFLLLIPYAVSGYERVAEKVENLCRGNFTQEKKLREYILQMAADRRTAAVIIVLFLLLAARMSESLFFIHSDDAEYTTLLLQHEEERKTLLPTLPDGRYVVSPVSMPGYGIHAAENQNAEEEKLAELSLMQGRNRGVLTLHHDYQYDLLRIETTGLLLSLTKPPQENALIAQDCDEILWKVIKTEDGNYAIQYHEFCLSVKDGRLCLEPFTGKQNQIWTFTKI